RWTCTSPAVRRGPRRSSRASPSSRSASRTRTWRPAGAAPRTWSRSSLADEATTEAEAPQAVTDERREVVLAALTDALGDAVVDSLIKPGLNLWVRVATEAWSEAADVAAARLGFRFFDFLSAIDWLPSPYGRYEDSAVDTPFPPAMPDRSAVEPGYTGGDTRFQVLGSVAKPGTDLRILLKAHVPDDDLRIGTWTRTYAGAAWHER